MRNNVGQTLTSAPSRGGRIPKVTAWSFGSFYPSEIVCQLTGTGLMRD